jgi:hypothetical protein
MPRPTDPLKAMAAWSAFATAYARMNLAASEVILRRTRQMAQGAMTPPEAVAMVMEKSTAFAAAAEQAAVAAARGAHPAKVAAAALRPYGTKTRANVRKLRK